MGEPRTGREVSGRSEGEEGDADASGQHLWPSRESQEQTRTPGGGTACPDPDPSHRPRSPPPGRGAPGLRTTSRGPGEAARSKGPVARGLRRSSVEPLSQWELKKGVLSAQEFRARGGGAARPTAQARRCAAARPAPRAQAHWAASPPPVVARARCPLCDGRQGLGGRGRKARNAVSARPARPPPLATPTSAVGPGDSSAAAPSDGNRAPQSAHDPAGSCLFKFRRPAAAS